MQILCVVCVVIASFQLSTSERATSPRVNIGGLFNKKNDDKTITAFQNIIRQMDLLQGKLMDRSAGDSFSTALSVCNATKSSAILALVDGRATEGICDTTCLLCNNLNIPHLSLGWQLPDILGDTPFTFYYHPPPEVISKAYAALIKDMAWDRFSILYEDDAGLIRLQEIMNTWPTNGEPIVYKRLDPNDDNKETFKYIFKVARISYHVLDCHVDNIEKYFNQIVEVENSTMYQSFILTALDAYKLNFSANSRLDANISTLHLTRNEEMKWKDIHMNGDIPLEAALAADAIHHFDKAVRHFQEIELHSRNTRAIKYQINNLPPLCFHDNKMEYKDAKWPSGSKLRQSLIETSIFGFTGNVSFDKEGKRVNFVLHHSKLNNDSQFVYSGEWKSNTDIIHKIVDVNDRATAGSNRPIMVVSRKGKPYFDVDPSGGPDSYRGFAVDLIKAIFEQINKNNTSNPLTYKFYRVPGDGYGNPIAGTKKWDGLLGELLEHRADMAVCDLSITSERISVVDFSTPFMTLGISMLFKKSDPEVPDKFSFIKPFSIDLWLYLGTAYIIVSYVLLICARMCQNDWVNPHPCNQNPETLQNIWSLYNCTWLMMGSIMTQGCDILPRGAGSRWITGMWWFFALIITASYTANMSTFLSNDRRSTDISDVNDLVKQNKIIAGAVYNASTYKFFMNSNDTVLKKIWSTMISTKPPPFENSNDAGKTRVNNGKGKYAFFMESTAIEYYTQRYCQLKMVGSNLDSKEYGIAMPKNFPHKKKVDNAILLLQESGQLKKLKDLWWVINDNDGNCQAIKADKLDDGSVQMENTSGIFLVLGLGGLIGLVVAIIDFLMHAKRIAADEKITFKESLKCEWQASLNPRVLHKPAMPLRLVHSPEHTQTSLRDRSQSRAVSVLRAATSFINLEEIY